MGVQDGIKARAQGALGGVGLDLEAQLGNIHVKVDTLHERLRGLEEYLRCPMFTPRLLEAVGNIPAGPAPLILDLGEVSPGRVWSVEGVSIGHTDPLGTSAAVANVIGAIFVGRPSVPPAIGQPSSIGQCIVPSLAVPTYQVIGGRRAIVSGGAHLYVLLSGAGLVAADQWFATASVTEAVDTPEALTWF